MLGGDEARLSGPGEPGRETSFCSLCFVFASNEMWYSTEGSDGVHQSGRPIVWSIPRIIQCSEHRLVLGGEVAGVPRIAEPLGQAALCRRGRIGTTFELGSSSKRTDLLHQAFNRVVGRIIQCSEHRLVFGGEVAGLPRLAEPLGQVALCRRGRIGTTS